jgi:hypothetical protein
MAEMWKKLIKKWEPGCEFASPASEKQILAAEKALGVKLPDELRELLLETNGVTGKYGPTLIWPVERIATDNLEFRRLPDFRELYMPFDQLLFIGDNGGGDQFAYAILDGVIRQSKIYRWCHETDAREYCAGSLIRFFESWRS